MSKLPLHRAADPMKIKDKLSRGINNLPEVEFLRPWRGYVVGVRIRPPAGLREFLMQQSYAKLVEDAPEPAAKKAPVKRRRKPAKAAPEQLDIEPTEAPEAAEEQGAE